MNDDFKAKLAIEEVLRSMLNGAGTTDTQTLVSEEGDTVARKTRATNNTTDTQTHTGAGSADSASDGVSGTINTNSGDVGAAQKADQKKQDTETTLKGLSTIPAENGFMVSLAGTTGRSPRRPKRFVNSYRVLNASLTPLDKETFIIDDGHKGDFLSAMTLLAITTGAPPLADKVLRYLYRPATNVTMSTAKKDIGAMSGNQSELSNVIEALTRYESRAGGADESLASLGQWAPRVARFTFRSGRL